MNFDRVAPRYRGLEMLVFGNRLQEARTAFVRQIEPPRRVLIVGEVDGRFLAELVRSHPRAEVDCVEASAGMISLAEKRVPGAHVHFICANLEQVKLEAQRYDLVVTHFFLDCFSEEKLGEVVAKLAAAATADAQWLIADFCLPASGSRRLRAQVQIAVMYLFFRLTAGIEASRLCDYRPLLEPAGFILRETSLSPNEIIRSEWWRRILA
ncbi:class I SAM-dependent methyltransferase [soil metagenome]